VKGLLRPRQRTSPVPPFWTLMMTRLYGTSDRFACQLWRHYEASPTLRWQLGLCEYVPESVEAWMSRVRHLSELITPGSLLAAAARLSPETGRRRDTEVLVFEARVLQQLDHQGNWRW
jgi:hypothetical protein